MKRLILILIGVLLISQMAYGQFSGYLSTAETVLKGTSTGSAFVGIYEDGYGVVAQYRRGVGGYTDMGIKLGLVDYDGGGSGFLASLDSKYQIMEVRIQDPLDLSVGGKIEIDVFENVNILSFGGFLTGSYPVAMKSGRALIPYGMLILRIDRSDPDHGDGDSEFNIGLNVGSALELSSSSKAYAEIQLDNEVAFYMGVEFGL